MKFQQTNESRARFNVPTVPSFHVDTLMSSIKDSGVVYSTTEPCIPAYLLNWGSVTISNVPRESLQETRHAKLLFFAQLLCTQMGVQSHSRAEALSLGISFESRTNRGSSENDVRDCGRVLLHSVLFTAIVIRFSSPNSDKRVGLISVTIGTDPPSCVVTLWPLMYCKWTSWARLTKII